MTTEQLTRLDLCRPWVHRAPADGPKRQDGRRTARLVATASAAYGALDLQIERSGVASAQRYGRFLRVLYLLHRDADEAYLRADLQRLLPDLAERRKFIRLANALTSLRLPLPASMLPRLSAQDSSATAVGWLFVAEAANLYAVALHRLIRRRSSPGSWAITGLFDTADVAESRWRALVAALDVAPLHSDQEEEMLGAAAQAALRLRQYVETESR